MNIIINLILIQDYVRYHPAPHHDRVLHTASSRSSGIQSHNLVNFRSFVNPGNQ